MNMKADTTVLEDVSHNRDPFLCFVTDHDSESIFAEIIDDLLLPDETLRIGALSEDSRKGTHTTTTARLYHMQSQDSLQGELIDSPGIREFGLTHLDEKTVTEGFIEFHEFLGHCRFRDCRHINEPGCALLEAVEAGKIHPQRFTSYRRILASLDTDR